MTEIKPIKRVKVSDSVYEQLKANILDCTWSSGTRLPSENKLCEMFDVSRVSVRAALNRLQAVGLIETRNGEGTYVKEYNPVSVWSTVFNNMKVSDEDIIEGLEVRLVLETAATSQLAQNHTPQNLEQLHDCLSAMEKYANEDKVVEYSLWDNKFHSTIVTLGGNKIATSIYNLLGEMLAQHIMIMNKEIKLEMGANYHKRIFAAIEDSDHELASKLAEESILNSINALKERSVKNDTAPEGNP